jgi:hypothetical protein
MGFCSFEYKFEFAEKFKSIRQRKSTPRYAAQRGVKKKKVLSATLPYATKCEIQVKNFLATPRYAAQREVDSALCGTAGS